MQPNSPIINSYRTEIRLSCLQRSAKGLAYRTNTGVKLKLEENTTNLAQWYTPILVLTKKLVSGLIAELFNFMCTGITVDQADATV